MHVCVQCDYSSGEEAVLESIGPWFDASVAPVRGQRFKQVGTRVRVVFFNVLSSAEAAGVVKVLQRGKRAANDPLRCWWSAVFPSFLPQYSCNTILLYSMSAGSPLQSDRRSPPAASPLGRSSLTLSRSEGAAVPSWWLLCVGWSFEVCWDDCAQEYECLNPLYTVSIDVEGSRVCPVPSKIKDDFLCFGGVNCQVVGWTPLWWSWLMISFL